MRPSPSALRMRRMRARAAGRAPTGHAAVHRPAVQAVRRRLFEAGDPLGVRFEGRRGHLRGYRRRPINQAIRHVMLVLADQGDPRPDLTLMAWAEQFKPPEHPVEFIRRAIDP